MAVSSSFRKLIYLLTFTTCALAVHDRLFTAARKSPNLRRRDQSLAPKYDSNTVYFDDGILAVAQVELNPILPMLILEDIDDHIASTDCSDSAIVMRFRDPISFDAAHSAWSNQTEFAVITNHKDCQTVGEHGVRRAHMTNGNRQILTITLSGHATSLRSISPLMTVEIGEHLKGHIDLRYLQARQVAPNSTNTFSTSGTPTATFTYATPTASATNTSLSSDISFSHSNTTLLPPDSWIAELIPSSIIPADMKLSCRNCSLSGNVELIAAGFTINDSAIEEAVDFVQNGYLKFTASGIAATMDFELAFLPGFSIKDFTAQLPSIPLGAIGIGGILIFGPVLDLLFPMTVILNSPVTLRTGFTLSTPPVTEIYLNMSDPESSYTTGFSQTNLEALPFTADAERLSINLTAGFKPQLVLGASVGEDTIDFSASGGIGVYLDLPQLTATVDLVDGVDEKCEPTISDPQNGLIRVSSSVTYGGGAQWNLDVNAFSFDHHYGDVVPLLSNNTALPTQCLMWDEKQGSLMDAGAVMESGKSGEKGSDAASKNVASALSPTVLSRGIACILVVLWSLC